MMSIPTWALKELASRNDFRGALSFYIRFCFAFSGLDQGITLTLAKMAEIMNMPLSTFTANYYLLVREGYLKVVPIGEGSRNGSATFISTERTFKSA